MNAVPKMQLLRGDIRSIKTDLRPPWSLAEDAFFRACDGCGECVTACEEKIIVLTPNKRPRLNFARGGCTFCGECASACDTGAIRRTHEPGELPWALQAGISDSCLEKRGANCMRCFEECEYDAIVAGTAPGGQRKVQVDKLVCTGCGMCIATCPVDEITLECRI